MDCELKPKCLAALLFHNDEDIVFDHINYYLNNNHELIIFNHNSNDKTHEFICSFKSKFIKYYILNKNIIFKENKVHETVSQILRGEKINYENVQIYDLNTDDVKEMNESDNYKYSENYDWISFPESDEFLEGPNREKNYYQHLCELHKTNKKAIQFLNYVFWFTEKDDNNIPSTLERVKHYSFFRNCGPRMYAWRAKLTNIRWFGHNLPNNCLDTDVVKWKTRHYDARSYEQFVKKTIDRKDVAIGGQNYHYKNRINNLTAVREYGIIYSDELHFDDGESELIADDKFNWNKVY